MSKNKERSFIARIDCNGIAMTFFEKVLSENFLQLNHDYETLRGNTVTTLESYDPISEQILPIAVAAGEVPTALLVHFRCYDDYYNLQIVSAPYAYRYISKNSDGALGAFPAAGGDTTSFNLLDGGLNIITLDDLKTDNPTIYLRARGAGIIRKFRWKSPVDRFCFHDSLGDSTTFNLNIIERNPA
ncbi:hypothetical protein [Pseudomonas sp. RA_35y_Pfl2_P32]|uniref:hypothetical protein n=1 Tax=Pseudomonas sp. RA_35y_Pfl2_P32 TaxID=3088705 RepID=UPI0030D8587F